MLAPFTKVVVDREEEAKFRRRALQRKPHEYIESLLGYVRRDTLYIAMFVPMEHDGKLTKVNYDDDELDEHDEDAKEVHLELLGTIHTHYESGDATLSEHDIRDIQETQEAVVAILNIEMRNKDGNPLRRCKTEIAYWPALRPFTIDRRSFKKNS